VGHPNFHDFMLCREEYKNGNGVSHDIDGCNKETPCCTSNFCDFQLNRNKRDNEEDSYPNTSTTSSTFSILNSLGGGSGLRKLNSPCQNMNFDKKDFFKKFINSVKSTESLSEVQPLLENKQSTPRLPT